MLDQLNIEPFVFFLGGTIQSDMMRYQVVPYPCRADRRWLDGLRDWEYIPYRSFPLDFWMHGTSSKSGKSEISEISFGNQLPGPMF